MYYAPLQKHASSCQGKEKKKPKGSRQARFSGEGIYVEKQVQHYRGHTIKKVTAEKEKQPLLKRTKPGVSQDPTKPRQPAAPKGGFHQKKGIRKLAE